LTVCVDSGEPVHVEPEWSEYVTVPVGTIEATWATLAVSYAVDPGPWPAQFWFVDPFLT
jgi:hypothetical protein